MDPKRELLRHTLATLAYRGGKAVREAPDSFADFRASEKTRTPVEILAHLGDLMDWCLSMARGKGTWNVSKPLAWRAEINRFFGAIEAFDGYLASDGALQVPAEKLFQSAIADSLTHIGQIAMLRRIAGDPLRGENYYVAEIAVGHVTLDQPAPVREFD